MPSLFVLISAKIIHSALRTRSADDVGRWCVSCGAFIDCRRCALETVVTAAVTYVIHELRIGFDGAGVRVSILEVDADIRIAENQIVGIGVMRSGHAHFTNAVDIIEHDIVGYMRVVIDCVVVETAAAYLDADIRAKHRVVGNDRIVCIVPELNGGFADLVHHIVLDGARRLMIDPLVVLAAGVADVMNDIAKDLDVDAVIVMGVRNAGGAVAFARHVSGDVVHVIVLEDDVGTTRGEADAPRWIASSVDLEALDVDIASVNRPCNSTCRVRGRYQLGTPFNVGYIANSGGSRTACGRTEAGGIRTRRNVHRRTGLRYLGCFQNGFEWSSSGAGV